MTAQRPSISIVIPTFDYERYVGACVRSVLEQSVPPLEVVVVNDGSTDGTAAVLARFGDRIRVIEQENCGQVAALNRGFAESRGDLVLFLDSDDLLHPDAVAEVLRAWRQECAKVQFELEFIDEEGLCMSRYCCNYVRSYDASAVQEEFARFGTYVWPVTSGNAYSRRYLEQVLPLRATLGPDGILNTLAPLYGSVEVVRRTLGYYRVHTANQSYFGFHGGAIGRRLARHVQIRRNEVRLLAEHAAARGRTLPPGNRLDHELLYVSYRLMLKQLGEDYEGAAADTLAGLWAAGMRVLARRPLPVRLKLAHAAWLTLLLGSPRCICRRLIQFRFNRAVLLQPIRRALASLSLVARRAAGSHGPTGNA